nr:N-alpha-acetyltransferase 80-like [Procambarus clarkii]
MTGKNGENSETFVVLLHRHPEYTEDCMNILNEQWPRSKTIRLRSLHSSCDQLPTSIALLRNISKEKVEVIGHARINMLPQEQTAAWVESVIIRQDLRGKGYGRQLMTKTEEYVRACGFNTIYLSTHDQQVFYNKLGYEFCAPVCIYGGTVNRHLLPKQFLTSLAPVPNNNTRVSMNTVEKVAHHSEDTSVQCKCLESTVILPNSNENTASYPHQASLPPPPPPPPPCSKIKKDNIQKLDITAMAKMYMKKYLM